MIMRNIIYLLLLVSISSRLIQLQKKHFQKFTWIRNLFTNKNKKNQVVQSGISKHIENIAIPSSIQLHQGNTTTAYRPFTHWNMARKISKKANFYSPLHNNQTSVAAQNSVSTTQAPVYFISEEICQNSIGHIIDLLAQASTKPNSKIIFAPKVLPMILAKLPSNLSVLEDSEANNALQASTSNYNSSTPQIIERISNNLSLQTPKLKYKLERLLKQNTTQSIQIQFCHKMTEKINTVIQNNTEKNSASLVKTSVGNSNKQKYSSKNNNNSLWINPRIIQHLVIYFLNEYKTYSSIEPEKTTSALTTTKTAEYNTMTPSPKNTTAQYISQNQEITYYITEKICSSPVQKIIELLTQATEQPHSKIILAPRVLPMILSKIATTLFAETDKRISMQASLLLWNNKAAIATTEQHRDSSTLNYAFGGFKLEKLMQENLSKSIELTLPRQLPRPLERLSSTLSKKASVETLTIANETLSKKDSNTFWVEPAILQQLAEYLIRNSKIIQNPHQTDTANSHDRVAFETAEDTTNQSGRIGGDTGDTHREYTNSYADSATAADNTGTRASHHNNYGSIGSSSTSNTGTNSNNNGSNTNSGGGSRVTMQQPIVTRNENNNDNTVEVELLAIFDKFSYKNGYCTPMCYDAIITDLDDNNTITSDHISDHIDRLMQKTCENQKRHLNSFDINITSDDILAAKETATLTKKAVDDSNNYTVEIQENISLHCDVYNKIQKVSTSWKGDNEAEEAGRKAMRWYLATHTVNRDSKIPIDSKNNAFVTAAKEEGMKILREKFSLNDESIFVCSGTENRQEQRPAI